MASNNINLVNHLSCTMPPSPTSPPSLTAPYYLPSIRSTADLCLALSDYPEITALILPYTHRFPSYLTIQHLIDHTADHYETQSEYQAYRSAILRHLTALPADPAHELAYYLSCVIRDLVRHWSSRACGCGRNWESQESSVLIETICSDMLTPLAVRLIEQRADTTPAWQVLSPVEVRLAKGTETMGHGLSPDQEISSLGSISSVLRILGAGFFDDREGYYHHWWLLPQERAAIQNAEEGKNRLVGFVEVMEDMDAQRWEAMGWYGEMVVGWVEYGWDGGEGGGHGCGWMT